MADSAHVLVVADTTEAAQKLAALLKATGHQITIADDFTPPPADCDILLVDVTRLRSSNPLALLSAQRRMGSQAPAVLCTPRLTEQMAGELFELSIRDFIMTPIDDTQLVTRLTDFITRIREEHDVAALRRDLEHVQETLERRIEEMNALSRIGRLITSLDDIGRMMLHIVEAAVYLTRANEGAIFLRDEDSGEVRLMAQQGFEMNKAEYVARPSQDSDVMQVMQSGQLIIRGSNSEHKITTGYLVRASINAPIISNQVVSGVLAVYNHGDRSFDHSDETVLVSLADYVAIALDRIAALKVLEGRIEEAFSVSRVVLLHARTMLTPIQGIESLIDLLLSSSGGTLTEKQQTSIGRIRQATFRLREVADLIQQEINNFEGGQ